MKIKKEHILLICILLTGIAARILKFEDPAIVMDTVAFSRLGKNLIENGSYVFEPGDPLFIHVTAKARRGDVRHYLFRLLIPAVEYNAGFGWQSQVLHWWESPGF